MISSQLLSTGGPNANAEQSLALLGSSAAREWVEKHVSEHQRNGTFPSIEKRLPNCPQNLLPQVCEVIIGHRACRSGRFTYRFIFPMFPYPSLTLDSHLLAVLVMRSALPGSLVQKPINVGIFYSPDSSRTSVELLPDAVERPAHGRQ